MACETELQTLEYWDEEVDQLSALFETTNQLLMDIGGELSLAQQSRQDAQAAVDDCQQNQGEPMAAATAAAGRSKPKHRSHIRVLCGFVELVQRMLKRE